MYHWLYQNAEASLGLMKRINALVLGLSVGLLTLSCASKKDAEERKASAEEAQAEADSSKHGKKWDYNRIRAARNAEAEESPADVDVIAEEAECQILTRAQMIRGKARGCKPVDPRAGHGDDKFCCVPEN
jgi:hypothetical protein